MPDSPDEFSREGWAKRRQDTWQVPNRYGFPTSVLMASSVGSPFLAGFSLTSAIVMIRVESKFAALADWSVILFVAAAGLFIFTVHATYWARLYIATPKEMLDWWPEKLNDRYLPHLIVEQRAQWEGFTKWHGLAKLAYNAAVLCLFAGLACAAYPGACKDFSSGARWFAFAVACCAFVFEVFWQYTVRRCLSWEERKQKGVTKKPWFVRLRGEPPDSLPVLLWRICKSPFTGLGWLIWLPFAGLLWIFEPSRVRRRWDNYMHDGEHRLPWFVRLIRPKVGDEQLRLREIPPASAPDDC